jgi:hypothetical protein
MIKALSEGEGMEDDIGGTLARMTLSTQMRREYGK